MLIENSTRFQAFVTLIFKVHVTVWWVTVVLFLFVSPTSSSFSWFIDLQSALFYRACCVNAFYQLNTVLQKVSPTDHTSLCACVSYLFKNLFQVAVTFQLEQMLTFMPFTLIGSQKKLLVMFICCWRHWWQCGTNSYQSIPKMSNHVQKNNSASQRPWL